MEYIVQLLFKYFSQLIPVWEYISLELQYWKDHRENQRSSL